jgi:hypothetical protein
MYRLTSIGLTTPPCGVPQVLCRPPVMRRSVLQPCPTPARSAADRDVGGATSDRDGSPPITRITLPTCCAYYPGGPERVRSSVTSPSRGLPRY